MKRNLILVLAFTLFVTSGLSAQSATALLQQFRQASLGSGTLPNDVTILADRVDDRGQSEPLKIQIKGKDKTRLDLGSGRSLKTTVYNGGAGWSIQNGKFQRLEEHASLRRPTLIPFLDLLAEMDHARIERSYDGLKSLGTSSAHQLTLTLKDPNPHQRMFRIPLDETARFFIDPATFLVVRSERTLRADNDMNFRVPSILEFSDYRKVGRFAVPFRIVNTTGSAAMGIHQTTVVVRSLSFDQGLPDSVFLPQ